MDDSSVRGLPRQQHDRAALELHLARRHRHAPPEPPPRRDRIIPFCYSPVAAEVPLAGVKLGGVCP